MKLVILACLATLAIAAPGPQEDVIEILRDDRQDSGDGNFNYDFETANGIVVSAVGVPGAEGQSNIEGSFSFPLPDGRTAEIRYIANENGFQPESDLLPTRPPVPEHVHELLRIAEQQRAEGVTFE